MTAGYRGKRAFDLTILATLAVPSGLIGLVCAVAVRASSEGPVLFKQARVGLRGRPFEVLKFRTMVHAPEGNPLFPQADRITSVGRVLRRFSLDEMPQLLNVLRGDMSIVGPRPTLQYQVDRYNEFQRHRLDVKPGLTGLAQINGRNALTWEERIVWDVEYVESASLLLDFRILLRTLRVVLWGEGVHGHPTEDAIANPAAGEGEVR